MSLKRNKRKQRTNIESASEDFFASVSPVKVTPKKRKQDDLGSSTFVVKSIFGQLVSNSGLSLTKGDRPNLLNCDQSVFRKKLKKALLLNPEFGMNCVDKFLKALEDFIEDPINFKGLLTYTLTAPDCETSRTDQQDSLFRIMLNIDELQPKLLKMLTEKLLEVAYDEEEQANIDLPPLILANIRWLDHIIEPEILAEKIVDLLEGSPTEIQKEVIHSVHNIVTDEYHSNIAKVFHSLYESTPELTPFLLEALSSLSLDADVLQEFHHSVLKTLQLVKPQNLPVVIKFLLNSTPQNIASQVTSDMREKIRLPADRKDVICQSQPYSSGVSSRKQSLTSKEIDDLELLIFMNIQHGFSVYKYLPTAWMKSIDNVVNMDKIKPLDLLVLGLIYEVIPTKRKLVESLLRNLVRIGLNPLPLLPDAFSAHSMVVKEYFESFKKLSDVLMVSSEQPISEFGSVMYRYCFVNMEGFQQQDVISSILLHLGDIENVRWSSLCLLCDLAHEETKHMSKYILFLKSSLDMMGPLSIRESKKLMDALIHLAHSSPDELSLKGELNILIRKQLSHADIKFKRLGVLSAVLTLKNSVLADNAGQGSENDSESTVGSGFSEGPLKEAEELFHLVKRTTADSPQSSALFMDELATIILKHGLNSKLEKWISDRLTSDFEETYIVEYEANDAGDFPVAVSFQWNLDESQTESEESNPIGVKIAKMVFKNVSSEKNEPSDEIVNMVSHFRLMRMVESHLNSGDLGNIDALLGCGVQLPQPSVYEELPMLPKGQKHAALDCLFYAINWFRELVNAFVTQKDPDLKRRVIQRFRKIIMLQELLSRVLPFAPDYVPPIFLFDFDVPKAPAPLMNGGSNPKKGKGKSTKKKSSDSNAKEKNESRMSGFSQTLATQTQKAQTKSDAEGNEVADLFKYKFFFRELHLDVFNLLFKTLSLEATLEEENGKYLCVDEAEFLLVDLNKKLARVLGRRLKRASALSKSGTDRDAGFSHIDVFDASEVAVEAVRYLKPVCAHLEKISQFYQHLIADADGIEDASTLHTVRTRQVADLYSALFETIKLILGWSSQMSSNNNDTFSNVLTMIGKNLEGASVSQMSQEELLKTVFRYLSNFSESIVFVSTAVSLADVLEVVVLLIKDSEIKKQFVGVIEGFLKKEWYTIGSSKDKGALFNKNLQFLLKVFFRHTSDPVLSVHRITSEGFRDILHSSAKDPCSELYPTLKKSTLTIYFGVMLENLVSGTHKLISSSSHNVDKKLEVWNVSIKTLYALLEPLKLFQLTMLLSSCLKHGHGYLKLFLSSGMPLLVDCLETKQAEVTAILKNLQLSTRFLQHLCNHAKCNQDNRMVQYVPMVKRSLETIVFRVKAMLALNKCQDAFWVGNLKNRDLQGEEILSQSIQSNDNESSSGADENEAELSDKELSDVDLDDDVSRTEQDYSASF